MGAEAKELTLGKHPRGNVQILVCIDRSHHGWHRGDASIEKVICPWRPRRRRFRCRTSL